MEKNQELFNIAISSPDNETRMNALKELKRRGNNQAREILADISKYKKKGGTEKDALQLYLIDIPKLKELVKKHKVGKLIALLKKITRKKIRDYKLYQNKNYREKHEYTIEAIIDALAECKSKKAIDILKHALDFKNIHIFAPAVRALVSLSQINYLKDLFKNRITEFEKEKKELTKLKAEVFPQTIIKHIETINIWRGPMEYDIEVKNPKIIEIEENIKNISKRISIVKAYL